MTPAGYHVVPSSGSPMLILDREAALQRAVQRHGTVTPLFSLEQVAAALDEACNYRASMFVRELA
jgi:hypothetical protein